jgi:DNA-binding transcriptional LysR family regulator
MQRMNWDNLRFFMAVSRSGNLSGAGRSLGVDPATVSRRIQQLEKELGTKLFLREPGGHLCTVAGARLLERAEALEKDILECKDAVTGETKPTGRVVITATEALAGAFVTRHLAALMGTHAGLSIELVHTERTLNLSRREADIALRLARPHQLDLRARRIGRLDFGLYASPAWAERHRLPRGPADLKTCDVIDWVYSGPDLPSVRWFAQITDAERVVFRSNSPGDRLTAARMGLGVAMAPCLMGNSDHSLMRLLPRLELAGPEVWLLVHKDLADLPRVRVVLNALSEWARQDARLFRGRPRSS